MDLGELTLEKAKAFEGTTFEISLDEGRTVTLKLDEVASYAAHQHRRGRAAAPKREPFALYFLGDPSLVLPQGMYALRSEAVTFDSLFIVPVGRDEQATEYEAVFT